MKIQRSVIQKSVRLIDNNKIFIKDNYYLELSNHKVYLCVMENDVFATLLECGGYIPSIEEFTIHTENPRVELQADTYKNSNVYTLLPKWLAIKTVENKRTLDKIIPHSK